MLAPLIPSSLGVAASGLSRPECVLCLRDGSLLVSHMGAGVAHIDTAGRRRMIGNVREVEGQPFVPNGFALMTDGSLLVANMGPGGGVWRLTLDGALSPSLREVGGQRLHATNFVLADGPRTWVSVSTRQWPISDAFAPGAADGYVVLMDGQGARIAADGLAFANEVRVDGQRRHLYVAETFAHRISRYPLREGGLGARETFAELGEAHFPDGMAFDAEGGLWVASIISHRVLRIVPDGTVTTMVDDSDPTALAGFSERLVAGAVTRDDVQGQRGTRLANPSSIAFGGPDLRTVYLGSLGGDEVFSFGTSVAGLPPAHWQQEISH